MSYLVIPKSWKTVVDCRQNRFQKSEFRIESQKEQHDEEKD
jgi:hypothetical protein